MTETKIERRSIIWTYISIFFEKFGNGLFLFPFILKNFPEETIGIWIIFFSITRITGLLDFGFHFSFIRNVSYVFSGAQFLQKKGLQALSDEQNINYNLLKGLIGMMNKFYSRVSWILFFFCLLLELIMFVLF